MSQKRKMLLLTLLGLVIPFANIFAPAFVSSLTGDDAHFRSRLLKAELIATIVGVIAGAAGWLEFMKDIVPGEALPAVSSINYLPSLVLPILIVALVVAFWNRTNSDIK